MSIVAITSVTGLLIGFALTLLGLAWNRRRECRWALGEANELIDSAKKDAEGHLEELNLQMEEMREDAFERFERDNRKIIQKLESLDEDLTEREGQLQETIKMREQLWNRKLQSLRSREQRLTQFQEKVDQLRTRLKNIQGQILDEAVQRSPVSSEDLKAQVQGQMEQVARTKATQMVQEIEHEAQLNLERDARKVIHLALNRFARPYCSERGIGNVNFDNADHKERVFGPNNQWAQMIEQLCGVDIVYNAEYQSATIMGFDPVRRELGRQVLEAASKQRNLSENSINDIHNRCKKEIFKKILTDGNRVANELKIPDLHEDVRSMLGALRYRYSFAQNQYFHVAEVGWLCGLMSAELGVELPSGRRAGLLHDIGKAMDHSKDGGHAVIGAEFIESHGEKPEIVHAVRAHHYDETPSTDLAFLTIAADAVSGARPGARRSTMDSYTQKMADLEKIGSSFEGVMGTYILSAGREVRVTVDGQRVDDHKALALSKQIAQKIEDELSYPGLIKVTVVRETQAIEFAR